MADIFPQMPPSKEKLAVTAAEDALSQAKTDSLAAVLHALNATDPVAAQLDIITKEALVKDAESNLSKAKIAYALSIAPNTESRWITANLADITAIGELLKDISNTLEDANGGVQALINIMNVIIAIVEIAAELVSTVEDIQATAIKAALEVLKIIKEELIELLNKIFNFGLYVLPHLESFDLPRAIRNELLSPGFEGVSLKPVDGYTKVPNIESSTDFHYERVLRNSSPNFGYAQFVTDIIESMDDQKDKLRPQFDNNTDVSGITFVVAADRISLFVCFYLLLKLFYKGKEGTIPAMKVLADEIRITLGLSASLGRTTNVETRTELELLLGQIDETTKVREVPEDISAIAKRFLDIFPRRADRNKDAEGPPEYTKGSEVTFSGPGVYDAIIQDSAITGNGILSDLVSGGLLKNVKQIDSNNTNAITIPNQPNFANYVTATVSTNSNGALFVEYKYNGNTYTAFVGSGQGSYEVTIPLISSTSAYFDGSAQKNPSGDTMNFDVEPQSFDNINWFDNNASLKASVTEPTRATFYLAPTTGSEKNPPDVDFKNAESQVIKVYIPRFERTETEGRGLGDSFRHSMLMQLDITSRATKSKIAKYMGISKEEVDMMFPMNVYPSTDLTKFGTGLDAVDIIIKARPQVTLNSSYTPRLIANGKVLTPDEKIFTTSTCRTVYTDVDLLDASTLVLQYIAQQNSTFDVDGTEKEYILYSDVETYSIQLTGGLLAAPTITSGDRVSGDGNGGFRLKFSPWNAVYGEPLSGNPQGSKTTEAETYRAEYRLTGKKASRAHVYVVIKGKKSSTVQWIGGYNLFKNGDDQNADWTNMYAGSLDLQWDPADKAGSKNKISVYQTVEADAYDKITQYETEEELLKSGWVHKSAAATKSIIVENSSSQLNPIPPNWENLSLNRFFEVVPPIEARLDELLEIIEDSIPDGPYDGIQDFLDLIKAKIKKIVAIFQAIQAILKNINDLLQIGGNGFYFLGIANAHGNEGFKQRIKKVPPQKELSAAKYVTGLQMLVPGEAGKALVGLWDKLPSSGQDNIVQDRDKSILERSKELYEKTVDDLKASTTQITMSSRKFNTKFDGAVTEGLKPKNIKKDLKTRKGFDGNE